MTELLLCCDMDRTVIPNGEQHEAPDARQQFRKLCQLPQVKLVYVTGRHLSLMQQAIKEFDLPQPDYAITDVGSRIYHQKDKSWQSLSSWQQEIDQNWIDNPSRVLDGLADIDGVIPQPAEKQNRHKISFFIDLTKLDENSCLKLVAQQIEKFDFKTNLIWSIDETTDTGLLDILPIKANKLHAIEFLCRQLNYPKNQVLFAGDSGNDLPVLSSRIPSVLVANATTELKQQTLILVEQQATQASFYQAVNGGSDDEVEATDYSGNYSAGVVQGVLHYYPQIKAYLSA